MDAEEALPDIARCPYEAYAHMRRAGGRAYWDDATRSWYVPSAEDLVDFLTDPRVSSRGASPPEPGLDPSDVDDIVEIEAFLGSWPVFSEDPVHRDLKRRLQPAFSRSTVERLRPVLRDGFETLAGEIGHGADLVRDFAVPAAGLSLSAVIGARDDELPALIEWSDRIMAYLSGDGQDGALARDAIAAVSSMQAFVEDPWLPRGASQATEALSEALREGHATLRDVTAMVAQLVTGSVEPLSSATVSVALAAVSDAQAREAVAGGRWDEAVVCGLLTDPPFHFAPRRAGEAMPDFHPDLQAGQRVVGLLASGNRDLKERAHGAFPVSSPHFSFGRGRHYCLGAALSRVALEEALRVLARSGALERVVPARAERAHTIGSTSFAALPLS